MRKNKKNNSVIKQLNDRSAGISKRSRKSSEINFDSLDGVTIRDTSGNGCKGIVFGDFSVMKDEKGQPSQRDSSIDIPKLGTDNDNKAY